MNIPCSKATIDNLKRDKINEINPNQNCAICYEDYKLNEIVINLNCSHIFHDICLISWLNLNNQCPFCRKKIE